MVARLVSNTFAVETNSVLFWDKKKYRGIRCSILFQLLSFKNTSGHLKCFLGYTSPRQKTDSGLVSHVSEIQRGEYSVATMDGWKI